MAANEAEENVVFLPLDIVKNSVGFSFDIGKTCYLFLYFSRYPSVLFCSLTVLGPIHTRRNSLLLPLSFDVNSP